MSYEETRPLTLRVQAEQRVLALGPAGGPDRAGSGTRGRVLRLGGPGARPGRLLCRDGLQPALVLECDRMCHISLCRLPWSTSVVSLPLPRV